MLIGVPKEVKNQEHRVGLIPSSVDQLIQDGHQVLVETRAGIGSGFSDDDYIKAGAKITTNVDEIFAKAEMIVKVKEPQALELLKLRKDQILYTYLHLAPDPEQTRGLIKSGCAAIAYETITDDRGRLPLLAPMSEVAGKLAVQCGARFLEKTFGGLGILLGGVPGTPRANVLILGGGYSGLNAAEVAIGMGADVTILDKSVARLAELHTMFGGRLKTIYSTHSAIKELIKDADLVIGAVLIPGAAAPSLVTRDMIKTMKKGSVMVDIAIDQGGCFETSRITTHDEPIFVEDGVIHYCVANMPGAVARTSAIALNNATLPFALLLANNGLEKALKMNKHLMNGLNVYQGKITNKAVFDALNGKLEMQYIDTKDLFC